MDSGPRMSRSTLEVLAFFLASKPPVYGLEIIKSTGLSSGTVYPILDRLERAGWLETEREDIDPKAEGRPPRRNYHLSGLGEQAARAELNAAARKLLRPSLRPRLGTEGW